ncbi:MAG: RNA polymerase subunit sigma-24 [Sphingobacteriales bacterium BACL12 MAG-120813-bin55]|jgi:RNA polymerase sigma factor (sigma-70 family)|nr:MAG: RNA polymerase subunit sigma-24 [Sphingobacteriales bacterium BACL12 MAG-120802-bin5]KRP10956.1 MAG: RNA polymerase subunit sigma-24 [Sphingobacteriales bacterium BACL12 MAG-120813-bin55]
MQVQSMPDKKLVKMYVSGDESALEVLINRHRDKIYSSVYFTVKDAALAEDIFQDTFVKVIDTLRSGRYREQDKFLPWVMRISYNLCIDHFRRNKRMPIITTGDGYDIFDVLGFQDKNIEDNLIADNTYSKVRSLVNNLPEEQRQVLILRHYSGMSFKEIAEMTGVSINTALGRMRYALINIRKMMAEKNISI